MHHDKAPPSTAATLGHEERRLRRIIAALVAAMAPAAAVQACSDEALSPLPGVDAGAGGAASIDASSQPDAGSEASGDAGQDASDAPIKSCTMKVTVFDSGNPDEPGCLYKLPCGLSAGLVTFGCDLYSEPDTPLFCKVEEGFGCEADAFSPGPGGEVHIVCPECLGSGRRPAGLERPRLDGARGLGRYFARAAHDEAASVTAFARLRDELATHGAPAPLLGAAERAARDEVRHARTMARLARAHGAAVPPARVRRTASRTLLAIARENAVEGCVHETAAALFAAWQAEHAPDEHLRATFARIAADEARHAALAWAVARWIEERLSPRGRASVAAARARATEALRRNGGSSPLDARVGLPSPRSRAALLAGLFDALDRAEGSRAPDRDGSSQTI